MTIHWGRWDRRSVMLASLMVIRTWLVPWCANGSPALMPVMMMMMMVLRVMRVTHSIWLPGDRWLLRMVPILCGRLWVGWVESGTGQRIGAWRWLALLHLLLISDQSSHCCRGSLSIVLSLWLAEKDRWASAGYSNGGSGGVRSSDHRIGLGCSFNHLAVVLVCCCSAQAYSWIIGVFHCMDNDLRGIPKHEWDASSKWQYCHWCNESFGNGCVIGYGVNAKWIIMVSYGMSNKCDSHNCGWAQWRSYNLHSEFFCQKGEKKKSWERNKSVCELRSKKLRWMKKKIVCQISWHISIRFTSNSRTKSSIAYMIVY